MNRTVKTIVVLGLRILLNLELSANCRWVSSKEHGTLRLSILKLTSSFMVLRTLKVNIGNKVHLLSESQSGSTKFTL